MSSLPLVDFLAGALTALYGIAALFFFRFYRKTKDVLFRSFALAFVLFGLNQCFVFWLGVEDERTGYFYVLRVLGFILILWAIVRKNLGSSSR